MFSSQEEFDLIFGWDPSFARSKDEMDSTHDLVRARVIGEERGLYRVQWSLEENRWASVSGRLQFSSSAREDFPAVGDWVWIEIPPSSDRAVIHRVMPRRSMIARKQVGPTSEIQILSTNVDTMLIATSVTDDLNYRRLERYLAIAWESGSVPVILLTKADTSIEPIEAVIADLRREFFGVEVHAVAKDAFTEAECLPRYLATGKTVVILGSSGVGKSTLVNFLIASGSDHESETQIIKTQGIRESDGRGRHTTTARSMYRSRFGGLIIDTPGMRELQLSDHADGIRTQFADIEDLANRCRFANCVHDTEPDCAIKTALSDGDLSIERWNSYLKLAAEARFEARKLDKALASEQKKIWAKRSAQGKNHRRLKRGYE